MKPKNYYTTQKKRHLLHTNYILVLLALVFTTTLTAQDVYVAGVEGNGTENVAKLWENGTTQDLTDGANNAIASSVFVDDGQLSTKTVASPQNRLSLYPNPVEDVLHINTPQPTSLQLYNLQGQLLQEIEAKQDTQVDISGWAPGVYFIKNINESATQKVIKE